MTRHHDHSGACGEYTRFEREGLSRRTFLRGAGGLGLGVAGLGAFPRVSLPAVGQSGGTPRDTILFVFLRGGLDALSMLPPYADPDYYQFRPTIALQPPGAGGTRDLDGFFGLAPAAAPLLAPYQAGDLAFVHAAGNSGTIFNRSHFSSMYLLETATPNTPGGAITSGWLARHMQEVSPLPGALVRGVAFDSLLPRTLFGAPATLPLTDPESVVVPGPAIGAGARRQAIAGLYAAESTLLGDAGASALDAVDLFAGLDLDAHVPNGGAVYPDTDFGLALARASALMQADVGVESIEVDLGGWDTHANQGALVGNMADLMTELSTGLNALWRDCASILDRVTVVAFSEFGRRIDENASLGTDHGRGGAMIVMGGHVFGGRVFGTWPGLAPAQQDDLALAVTTDYRDILAEILADRAGNTTQATVFPDYTPTYHGITSVL